MRIFFRWGIQSGLAAIFIFYGWALFINLPDLRETLAPFPVGLRQFIGLGEVFGGLGLVMPELTQTATWLTPTSALGLLVVMTGAVATHILHGELFRAIPPGILLVLLGYLVWQQR